MEDEIIPWRRSPIIVGLLVALAFLGICGMVTFFYGIRTQMSVERQTATVSALTATPTSRPPPTPTPVPTPSPEVPASARTTVRICTALPQFMVLALAVVFVIYMSRRRKV